MEDSFKEKIRLAKSFNQNTVIRNGKLGRIFENTRIIAPEENCLLTLKLIQTLTITERGGAIFLKSNCPNTFQKYLTIAQLYNLFLDCYKNTNRALGFVLD